MKMTVISQAIANFFHLIFAVLLVALSVHLIHLAIGHILESFQVDNAVDAIFNAIWLITVAIVVFDLGIIIFDEIIWEGRKKSLSEFKREFNKFLIVIITALLIESLVVFFRVAKKDIVLLSYPALSILAVCALILSLAVYMRFSVDKTDEREDPLQILRIKYAKGEISRRDFKERIYNTCNELLGTEIIVPPGASPLPAVRTGGAFSDLKAEIVASLRNLHDLLKVINSTLDINEVVELILEKTASLMRARRVLLLRLDPSKTELFVYRAHGFREEELPVHRFPGVHSFDHCLVHKGTVIHFEELLAKDAYEKAIAAVPALAKMFFAPLEIQGKAYGLLGVSGGRQDFSEIELEIFCSLAGQAAVAIENAGLHQRLKETFHHTAAALAEAVNSRDPYTGGHVQRVQDYSLQIATALKMPEEQRDALRLAAILHDIGKIGIDDAILRKGGGLSEEEQRRMQRHPEIGARILAKADGMKEVVPGVRHHHEWFDGSGYPDGLAGGNIPLPARIIAIADAFDALTTDRPYHTALPFSAALDELARGAGKHFDPALVKIFAEGIHSA